MLTFVKMSFGGKTLVTLDFLKKLLKSHLFSEIRPPLIYFIYIERLIKEVLFLAKNFIHTHTYHTH